MPSSNVQTYQIAAFVNSEVALPGAAGCGHNARSPVGALRQLQQVPLVHGENELAGVGPGQSLTTCGQVPTAPIVEENRE